MSYHQLEVYRLARELVQDIHLMTLTCLPDYEKYETGSQIRRSVKSIKSNIVEGYGRRSYKKDFLHFLIMAYSSAEETIDHLDTLLQTGSIKNDEKYLHLHQKADLLARKLNCFIKAVRKNHRT
jgi:four helix bundle protein